MPTKAQLDAIPNDPYGSVRHHSITISPRLVSVPISAVTPRGGLDVDTLRYLAWQLWSVPPAKFAEIPAEGWRERIGRENKEKVARLMGLRG